MRSDLSVLLSSYATVLSVCTVVLYVYITLSHQTPRSTTAEERGHEAPRTRTHRQADKQTGRDTDKESTP